MRASSASTSPSPRSRRRARLAVELGLDDRAEFVVADVYDAVEALGGRTFDVVYTGIGALTWLPDIDRWAQTVRGAGRGQAVCCTSSRSIPFLWPFGDTPDPELAYPYFGVVESDDAFGSYTDRALPTRAQPRVRAQLGAWARSITGRHRGRA